MSVDKPISFSSSHPDVSIDFYMPRTVWITDNTPIYIHLTIQNNTLDHRVSFYFYVILFIHLHLHLD
jgi:hypothetical protein